MPKFTPFWKFAPRASHSAAVAVCGHSIGAVVYGLKSLILLCHRENVDSKRVAAHL